MNGGGVHGGHPEARHGLRRVKVFDHFVHEKLSLAVRVARVHDRFSAGNEAPDRVELALHARVVARRDDPLVGENRQILDAPDLLSLLRAGNRVGEVVVGLGLFEQVAEAPRDDVFVLAVNGDAVAAHDAQRVGDRLGDRRFFSDEKTHGIIRGSSRGGGRSFFPRAAWRSWA